MAYKPNHIETLEYRQNDKDIKKIFKKIKNIQESLKMLAIYASNTTDDCNTLEETMKALIGTKRYKGREITIWKQYAIISEYRKLKEITLGEK